MYFFRLFSSIIICISSVILLMTLLGVKGVGFQQLYKGWNCSQLMSISLKSQGVEWWALGGLCLKPLEDLLFKVTSEYNNSFLFRILDKKYNTTFKGSDLGTYKVNSKVNNTQVEQCKISQCEKEFNSLQWWKH